jgi:hypothetical protein
MAVSRARPPSWPVVLLLLLSARAAQAQTFEVAPFGGYRFGGDLYEVYLGRPLDVDGSPSFGVTLDFFVNRGTSVSFLYSREDAKAGTRSTTLFVEHWHGGGTYELERGAIRPFLAGSAGLTRFGSAHDSEIRFSAAGGGGVKLMPSRHLGVRLDGRLYAVFVDGHVGGLACGGGACVVDLDVFMLWQTEFTAAVVVSF